MVKKEIQIAGAVRAFSPASEATNSIFFKGGKL